MGTYPETLEELIVEVVGPKQLHQLLMEFDKTFEAETFNTLLFVSIRRIGLRKIIPCIFEVADFPRDQFLDLCMNSLTVKHAAIYYNSLLTPRVSSEEIIKLLDVSQIANVLQYMIYNKNSFSLKELFERITMKFKPNIHDSVPLFQFINYIQVNGESFKLSHTERMNVNLIIKKLLKTEIVDVSDDELKVADDTLIDDVEKFTDTAMGFSLDEIKSVIIAEIKTLPRRKLYFDVLLDAIIEKSSVEQLRGYLDKHCEKFGIMDIDNEEDEDNEDDKEVEEDEEDEDDEDDKEVEDDEEDEDDEDDMEVEHDEEDKDDEDEEDMEDE